MIALHSDLNIFFTNSYYHHSMQPLVIFRIYFNADRCFTKISEFLHNNGILIFFRNFLHYFLKNRKFALGVIFLLSSFSDVHQYVQIEKVP